MNDSATCDYIQRSALTEDLTDEQCAELSQIATTCKLKDAEVLIEQGQTDDSLHIIAEGALAVQRNASVDDTVTLHMLKRGDLAGEMGFVDGTSHSATLRAFGDTTIVSIKRSDLEGILTTKPEIVYGVMRGIIRVVHRIVREMNLTSVELNNYITKTHGRY